VSRYPRTEFPPAAGTTKRLISSSKGGTVTTNPTYTVHGRRIHVTPSPRAPWWRSEQAYRRRGAWLEWQRPTPWRRGLAAAAWLYLAAHLAVWVAR